MDLIILNDGMYSLLSVTKQMIDGIVLTKDIDCFDLCEILRIKLATYIDYPVNEHLMKDGSGDFIGCICN